MSKKIFNPWTITKGEPMDIKTALYTICNNNNNGWNIEAIESITEEMAKIMALDHMTIKEHDVYFINFGRYFKYSCVVFWNGHLIRFAGDYESHHEGKTREELKEWYIECLNNKLYTEKELAEPLKDYHDYQRRMYFLNNYYGDRENHVSCFNICHNEEEKMMLAESKQNLHLNNICFGYYESEEFCKHCAELEKQIDKVKEDMKNNYDYWYRAFYYEFSNFECIYGGRYDEAASTVLNGMTANELQRKAYIAAKTNYENDCLEHDC